ncbi:hypothetical protein B1810_07805 [Panacagrimonas perspica]|nr:hypothetical protein B1810_07805 [Panacagrimonas perspica]
MRSGWPILFAACLVVVACGSGEPAAEKTHKELSVDELNAEPAEPSLDAGALPPARSTNDGDFPAVAMTGSPVDIAQAKSLRLRLVAETAYLDERQRYVVDLLERDLAYLTLVVETADGRPVRGAIPQFSVTGSSRMVPMTEHPTTDDSGWLDFGVVGGKMGSDRVDVTVADQKIEVLLNVISLKAMGFAKLDEIEGGLRWETLMQARLRFEGEKVSADFPAEIAMKHGKTVKLIGFMMPLEAEENQKHFLLTSNPPSCFFHIPGGPAGAVEVFADTGVKASWDPIVLEGRFETVQGGQLGVIYRLRQARVMSK